MANNCVYDIRLFGKPESVDEAIKFVKDRSLETEIHDESISDEGKTKDVYIHGCCKWSAKASWRLDKHKMKEYHEELSEALADCKPEDITQTDKLALKSSKTLSECESLLDIKDNIFIELYTEDDEDYVSNAEHYIITDGNVKLDDTRLQHVEFNENEEEYKVGGFKVYTFDFDVNKNIPEHNKV